MPNPNSFASSKGLCACGKHCIRGYLTLIRMIELCLTLTPSHLQRVCVLVGLDQTRCKLKSQLTKKDL